MANILIYEEWSHFIPTGLSWANGFSELGHKVFHLSPRMFNSIDRELLLNKLPQVDIIIWFDLITSNEELLKIETIKYRCNAKIVIAVGLNYKEKYYDFNKIIDYWVSTTYKHKSQDELFRLNGYDLIHIPLAADNKIFFPISNIKKYDVSFIGQFDNTCHGYRRQDEYLFPIIDNSNLTGYYSGFLYKDYNFNFTHYNDLNDIYNSTNINLNFHYDEQKGIDGDRIDFNARTFEICLTNQFQLCDHPYINELIPSLYVEQDGNKWKDIVFNFLHYNELRVEIANKAYSEVINNHLWKHRMQTLLNKITQGVN